MRWGSGISADRPLPEGVNEAADALAASLEGDAPHLVVAFVSSHRQADWDAVGGLVARRFPRALLVGCTAGGVIGGGREVELLPAVALAGASLPGVRLTPFHIEGDGGVPVPARDGGDPALLVLADPYTCDVERVLGTLDFSYPGAVKVGGVASGMPPGEGVLFLGKDVLGSGAAGVRLDGDVRVEAVVAQGCRPVGAPLFVTRARHNIVFELDGRRAVDVLQDLFGQLSPRDRGLFRHSLFLGLVMEPARSSYRQGDFLVRNITGVDMDSGAIAVAAPVATTQVVQFHLRDASTSAADVEELLRRASSAEAPAPAGALLFSCIGRGAGLYGRPNHDSDVLQRHFGLAPAGGFFCNGEIGPVGDRTFLHGYTSCFGLFRPRGK